MNEQKTKAGRSPKRENAGRKIISGLVSQKTKRPRRSKTVGDHGVSGGPDRTVSSLQRRDENEGSTPGINGSVEPISYERFLSEKSIVAEPAGIPDAKVTSEGLLLFARACCEWALKRGRAALFEGTGLTKTAQQCEWARQVEGEIKKPVLIVAPLAVSHQTIVEAQVRLGVEIQFAESNSIVSDRGIYITNYQKLHRFTASLFGGVVWDESSCIKHQDAKTRQVLLDMFGMTPFRLACTATPAPNDYMELGSHAEVLGIMKATEMLSTFFVHDGGETQKWKLKSHAQNSFWKWLASWSICITHPEDIGFQQPGFDLPPLKIHEHIVDCDAKPLSGELFALPARTLAERRVARRETIGERVDKCLELVNSCPDEQWLVWCNLNAEAEQIAKEGNFVNITGSDEDAAKESRMLRFASGEIKRLVTKPSLAGFGLNWQQCHKMIFLGLSDSWEQMHQAVRRCYRFGQKHPVDVHIVISSLEGAVLQNIKRKEADAQRMQKALVEHMADLTKRQLTSSKREQIEYKPKTKLELPNWI